MGEQCVWSKRFLRDSRGVTAGTVIISITGNNIIVDTPQTISNDVELFIGGTDPGGFKELFAVSSNYVVSSN